MEEEKTLTEQLNELYQEQSETENAYAENEGRIDESILVAWAEEILEREEKIKQLKQQLAEQTVPLKPDEKKEEKSLVVVKLCVCYLWIYVFAILADV